MTAPSQLSYTLDSVKVTAQRGDGDPVTYDVTAIVGELNVFESVDSPVLTGSCVLIDSASMLSLINFNGTETLTASLYVAKDFPVDLEMSVVAVSPSVKDPSDGVTVYTLELVERHGFLSKFSRIRKALVGEIGGIVGSLFKEYFSLDVEVSEKFKSVHVIVPDKTPVETAKWLVDRTTTALGEPVYLYSTIRRGVVLESLGSMIENGRVDPESYVFTQVPSGTDFSSETRRILSMTFDRSDDIMRLMSVGAIRSKLFAIDPYLKQVDTVDFSVSDHFRRRVDAGRELAGNLTIDESFELPDGKRITDKSTVYVSRTNTTWQYGENARALTEERSSGELARRIQASSVRAFMDTRVATVTMPGYRFLSTEDHATVGRVVEVLVPKDQPAYGEKDLEKILDKRRSGLYLVTACRHMFNIDRRYYVSMELSRMSTEDELTDSEERPK